MKPSADDLLEFDKNHIWHPYTSATNPLPTTLIEGADGIYLSTSNGTKLVDGMSSWWCTIHGYNHPELNAAAKDQIDRMSHVMFGGITHRPAVDLCQRLLDIIPHNLEHVFLADSGSISVEVAIKMAIQYWQAKGLGNKTKLISPRGGYHGDTFAAMSVCDPETGMHHIFNDAVIQQRFADRPNCRFDEPFDSQSTNAIETLIKDNHQHTAAVILEPIVQGAGGMWFYHPNYLAKVRELCDQYQLLLIVDEIATGFGRTGKMFACEWADIEPDIMCVGKALTGGYLSLAATLATKEVAHGISQNGGVFMHGPTFMGNPLACAVAVASLKLLKSGQWQTAIPKIEQTMSSLLAPARDLPNVADVRVLGGIGVIEMSQPVNVAHAQAFFIQQGVWIRPFGKLIYIMPPYIIGHDELTILCHSMVSYAQSLNN